MWTRLHANRLTIGVVAGSLSVAAALIAAQSDAQSLMRQSPLRAAQYLKADAYKHRQELLFSEEQMGVLASSGLLICDDVLSASELISARRDVDKLLLGRRSFEANGHRDTDVRSDTVMWISESLLHESILNDDYLPDSLKLLMRVVRGVPLELERGLGLGHNELGVPVSNQLACYDGGGAKYIAHRDSPPEGASEDAAEYMNRARRFLLSQHTMSDRRYTIILYINEQSWDGDKGGYLRCYLGADASDDTGASSACDQTVDIEPRGGRLVVFDSRRVLHEVLPSPRRRLALTCWCGGPHASDNDDDSDNTRASLLQLLSSPAEEFDRAKLQSVVYKHIFGGDR